MKPFNKEDFLNLEKWLNFKIDEDLQKTFYQQVDSYQKGFNNLANYVLPNNISPTDFGTLTSFSSLRKDEPVNVNSEKVYQCASNKKDHFVVIK